MDTENTSPQPEETPADEVEELVEELELHSAAGIGLDDAEATSSSCTCQTCTCRAAC